MLTINEAKMLYLYIVDNGIYEGKLTEPPKLVDQQQRYYKKINESACSPLLFNIVNLEYKN